MIEPALETQAERIIRKLGGRLEAMRVTGLPETKIDSMKKTGKVMHEDWQNILDRAAAEGKDITPFDFVAHLRWCLADFQPEGASPA